MKIAGIGKIMLSSVMAMSVMALAACGPGSTASSSSTSEAVSTDLGTDKISLTLWDGAGMKDYDNALIKAFEKKYTNVTITATYDPDNTSAQNGPRIIASSSAPDIARITDISSAVKGKHVVNLDSYAKAYNWSIPDSQTAVYRVSDSTGIGSGSLYAVPDGVSLTGMYWNKAVAKKLGITSAPTTIAELEKDMKLAKAAGVTPMIMPAKEGGTSYIYQALWTNNSGKDTVQKWILQKKNATINEKGAIAAATTIQKWQTSGYFSSDANALDGTTALSRFTGSQGLFFPSGSWYSASIYKALGDDAGFFAYPGTTSSQKASAASNAVTAFGIPTNAKHKNAAAAFLNFLLSDEARQISVDYGYPAIGTGTTPSTDNTVLSEILTAYDGLVESGNTTDYINNATAAMQASGIIPNFQTLLDGSMTPKAFVQAIQKQYDSELD